MDVSQKVEKRGRFLFDSNRSSYLGWRTVEKDDFSHRPFSSLPLTEKVVRYLFASAEEVPHVLRSFFHLRLRQGRQVHTTGHLFTTRDNALHHLFCAPDVQLKRPLCATCELTHDFLRKPALTVMRRTLARARFAIFRLRMCHAMAPQFNHIGKWLSAASSCKKN